MKPRPRALVLGACALATSAVLLPAITVEVRAGEQIGPDVVDFYVANSINYLGSVEGIGGYAFGTTSCNYGDMVADWYGGTNQTPLIGQNAYRLKNGRFEQIGTSWLKHSFCALSEGGCGDCQPTDCDTLGIGCADTYGAGLNTNPGGPRSEVNAFLGSYDYPFINSPSGVATLRGNLCIADNDIDPALNEGARYFFEGFYVCTDEAPWGTQFNNASWREITFTGVGEPTAIGSTQVAEMAIRTWQQIDPEVMLTDIMVPKDGLIVVGSKVTELSNGTWRYEYAIYNYNCDRSVGAVAIMIPEGATATNVGFHDVDYHSGEVWDSTDWPGIQADGQLRWSTTSHADNPLANAIRWDSLYNVRFDLPAPPITGELSLELFKPGGIPSITAAAIVPETKPIDPCELPLDNCAIDIDGSMVVDVADVLRVIEDFGTCGDGTFRPEADVDGDCCVGVGDVLEIISQWDEICADPGACCLADGSCIDSTEADCLASGGTFNGMGIPCYDVNCPIPGACCLSDVDCDVLFLDDCLEQEGDFRGYGTICDQIDCSQAEYNDDCQDAWLVTNGDHEFNTMSSTTDGPPHKECDFDGQTYNDIWYRYTATCNGLLAISTCSLVNYDSDLVAYRGWDCDNLELIDCNDDADGCDNYSSRLEIPALEGDEILIRVGGWQESDAGSGILRISCSTQSACCFDDGSCQLAWELDCLDTGGVWQGNETTCEDIACPQPGACCFLDETCAVMLEPVCVQSEGNFQGELTDCDTSDCSLTAENDDCQDAWIIEDGDTEFSTLYATTDGNAHEECKWTGQTFSDIWFHYTATCSGILTVSTCNLADYDTDLVLYDGWNCDELIFLDCNDDGAGCEGYTSHIEVDITSGQAITIRVGGWKDGNVGTGTLRVECESNE